MERKTMGKFLNNIISIIIYALIFIIFISIGEWELNPNEATSLSLILGFFDAMINNIERVLRELDYDKNEPWKKKKL